MSSRSWLNVEVLREVMKCDEGLDFRCKWEKKRKNVLGKTLEWSKLPVSMGKQWIHHPASTLSHAAELSGKWQ